MVADPPQLILRDVAAWRTWLAENVEEQVGVWLVLAKKGDDGSAESELCRCARGGAVSRLDRRSGPSPR